MDIPRQEYWCLYLCPMYRSHLKFCLNFLGKTVRTTRKYMQYPIFHHHYQLMLLFVKIKCLDILWLWQTSLEMPKRITNKTNFGES